MKITLIDVWTRLNIAISRIMKPEHSNGVVIFGENNDYPHITERIINNSVTAKSCARILKSFIVGSGYNDEVNNIVIGYDATNKPITVYELMRQLAFDIAYHNGCYVFVGQNIDASIKVLKHVPFKNCRFEKFDDTGYTSKIYVYDNWPKNEKFEKSKIREFPIYSMSEAVFEERVKQYGGLDRYPGSIDYFFAERNYIYPLAHIDSVFHDCDAEFGASLFRDNIFRNGIMDKVIIRVAPLKDDQERIELKKKLLNLISADGDPVLVLEDDVDATGNISNANLKIDKIDSNIKAEMFEKLEPILTNRIRKAYYAIPAVLIDYDESKLGTTSGEALIQAVNYYNAITDELRTAFGNWLAGLLQETDNPTLQNNIDWTIKPLTLEKYISNGNNQNNNISGAVGN